MITILPAAPHHAEQMHEIEAAVFTEPWSEISIKYEVMHKDTVAFVATDESENVIGHVYMRHILDEGHISNIAVRKSHRKLGIGALLVEKLLEVARNRQMIGLTLEVRTSNRDAISLYKKHGFTAKGIRKGYYSQPREDGIIMWKYF